MLSVLSALCQVWLHSLLNEITLFVLLVSRANEGLFFAFPELTNLTWLKCYDFYISSTGSLVSLFVTFHQVVVLQEMVDLRWLLLQLIFSLLLGVKRSSLSCCKRVCSKTIIVSWSLQNWIVICTPTRSIMNCDCCTLIFLIFFS